MLAGKTIVVVGGGASGTLAAYHLRRQNAGVRAIVVDPRSELGLGLAYSTQSMSHLLNVPAGKIGALPDEPTHFLDWLREKHDSEATAFTFAPRAVFGRYLQSVIETMSAVEHLRTEVVDCRLASAGAVLTLRDGSSLTADAVVLALGNFEPAALNGVSAEAVESGVYCHNAWDPRTYEGLAADALVVLIGTGLTGVDVLLRLRELGYRGTVTGVSRHGMMPRRHEPYESLDVCAIAADTPATALEYLRAFRAALRKEPDWRAVVDSLRENTNMLWLALTREEQRRFRRHLQRRWDVVRHRMAPSIADEIERELGDGSFVLCGGRLQSVTVEDGGARVEVCTRDGVRCWRAARVINCTGPSMNYREVRSPLLQSLLRQGLAVPGELGGGLRTDATGALFGGDGGVSDRLFTLGPPRMGTLLESIAIPEICQQSAALADQLIEKLNSSRENSRLSRADAPEVVGA